VIDTKKKVKKSMEKSIDNYGQVQLLMVCEEMGELIQAISKMERLMDEKDKKHKHKQQHNCNSNNPCQRTNT
jgi:hypothetical protein